LRCRPQKKAGDDSRLPESPPTGFHNLRTVGSRIPTLRRIRPLYATKLVVCGSCSLPSLLTWHHRTPLASCSDPWIRAHEAVEITRFFAAKASPLLWMVGLILFRDFSRPRHAAPLRLVVPPIHCRLWHPLSLKRLVAWFPDPLPDVATFPQESRFFRHTALARAAPLANPLRPRVSRPRTPSIGLIPTK